MKQQLPEMSPSRVWRFAAAAGISALFLVLDQITKAVVRNALALGVPGPELIPGVIRLFYVQNVGAAFSLGEGLGGAFILLALAVIAATVWYLWKTPLLSHLEVVGLAMVVGGAVGNAIDRLTCGYVVDFLPRSSLISLSSMLPISASPLELFWHSSGSRSFLPPIRSMRRRSSIVAMPRRVLSAKQSVQLVRRATPDGRHALFGRYVRCRFAYRCLSWCSVGHALAFCMRAFARGGLRRCER